MLKFSNKFHIQRWLSFLQAEIANYCKFCVILAIVKYISPSGYLFFYNFFLKINIWDEKIGN